MARIAALAWAIAFVLALPTTPAVGAVQVRFVGTIDRVDDYLAPIADIGTPVEIQVRYDPTVPPDFLRSEWYDLAFYRGNLVSARVALGASSFKIRRFSDEAGTVVRDFRFEGDPATGP